MSQEFYRARRGGPIPAALLNAHSAAVEEVHASALAAGGWDFGQLHLPQAQPETFYAVITGSDGGTPPRYTWEFAGDMLTNGSRVYVAGQAALQGILDGPEGNAHACEAGGNREVPVGAVVRLWPSAEGVCWEFEYHPAASVAVPPGGSFNSTGGTFTLTNNTWNVSGDVYNYGTGGHPVTVNYAYGILSFPTYSNPAAAPPAYFVLPVLTGTPPPTWTPPAAGILVCSPPYLFQSTATGWTPYAPWNPTNFPPPQNGVVFPDATGHLTTDQYFSYNPSTVQLTVGTATPVTSTTTTLTSHSDTYAAVVIQGNSPTQSSNIEQVLRYPGGPQVYVIRSDGIVQYPTTNSTATPPSGQLSLPTLTVTGAPTWTPPAGTYPEVWNQFDRTLYAWDGSAWDPIGGTLTVGTTPVASGTTGRILYDNAGVLGELAVPLATSQGGTGVDTSAAVPLALGGTPTLTATPTVFKVTITYASLAAASITSSALLFNLPAGGVLQAAVCDHTQSFTGGGIAAYSLSLGRTAAGEYTAVRNVFGAPSDPPTVNAGSVLLPVCRSIHGAAATAVNAYASTDGGHLTNQATQGSADFYLLLWKAG